MADRKMLSLKQALKPVSEEVLGTASGGYIIYGCCASAFKKGLYLPPSDPNQTYCSVNQCLT